MTKKAQADFLILRTDDWQINHRIDSALPGYLIVGASKPTRELSQMPAKALAELGGLLAKAQQALTEILQPEHLYIGRYGHTSGLSFHFHVIPICTWVKQSFFDDPRYRVLQNFGERSGTCETDGAELTLYVWREFCESLNPPAILGPTVGEVIDNLKRKMITSDVDCMPED
jgi:diadenosine tetraphosphate (Ap4A) HIT family hydrolase